MTFKNKLWCLITMFELTATLYMTTTNYDEDVTYIPISKKPK